MEHEIMSRSYNQQTTYCPICNLWGVSEDHAMMYHGVIGRTTGTSSNSDYVPTTNDFSNPYKKKNKNDDKSHIIKYKPEENKQKLKHSWQEVQLHNIKEVFKITDDFLQMRFDPQKTMDFFDSKKTPKWIRQLVKNEGKLPSLYIDHRFDEKLYILSWYIKLRSESVHQLNVGDFLILTKDDEVLFISKFMNSHLFRLSK